MAFFLLNIWSVLIFAVPLQMLSRNNDTRWQLRKELATPTLLRQGMASELSLLSAKTKSSLKDLHNREVVVQEAI
ncbi:MAG: hypothetical protein ACI3Y0_01830, partial [Prevotella sp.]